MIAGKDASRFGEGKNSWLTGTAAWNMVAISQYILGVQADFDGLKIDPSIPHEWDGMTATRTEVQHTTSLLRTLTTFARA